MKASLKANMSKSILAQIVFIAAIMALQSTDLLFAKEIEFRFHPPDSITYLQNLKTTSHTDMGTLGKSDKQVETSTRVTITRKADGYKVLAVPLSANVTRDGKVVDDPIVSLLQNFAVEYNLDTAGQVISIGGYENVEDILKQTLPAELVGSLSAVLSAEALSAKSIAEWNGRIGSYVGRKAVLGDAWTSVDSFSLPGGKNLKFYSVIKFPEQSKCGEKKCLKVDFRYNSDATSLFEFAGKAASELAAAMGDTTHALEPSGGEIVGSGTRLIDPATMLIYSESISRTLKTKMNIPGQGDIDVREDETREYNFKY